MARSRLRDLRRRQPLLRGGGRVHAPHRSAHGEARRAVGARSTGARRCWSRGKVNRFIPNPTFDPVAKPGCLDQYYRGRNPNGPVDARAVRRARADPPRVPRARRAARGDGRAGHRARVPVPDARRRHGGGAARGPRGALRRLPRLQPVARTRTGASASASACTARRCITLVDPAERGRRSSSGCSRATRASSACARRRCATPDGSRSLGDPLFDPFWARVAGVGRRGRLPRRRPAATTSYADDWGEGGGLPRVRRHAAARSDHGRPRAVRHLRGADLPRRVRPLPAPAHGERSRWARTGCASCCASSAKSYGQSAERLLARTRSRPSSDTSGCRPSTRRTCAAWPI